jgi:hypothetical protein
MERTIFTYSPCMRQQTVKAPVEFDVQDFLLYKTPIVNRQQNFEYFGSDFDV